MSRILRWFGTFIGVLVGLAIVGLVILYMTTEVRLRKTFAVPSSATMIRQDPGLAPHGQHLVDAILFCKECHGDSLSGKVLQDDLLTGRLVSSNLTSGAGGAARTFRDEDWVRAIRYGVQPDGKPLIAMPSNLFNHLSDTDLVAVIAYVKSMPPVDNQVPPVYAGPLARVIITLDSTLIPAEVIDPAQPRPPAPVPGITVEYGRYLALTCTTCHGDDLGGKAGEGGGLNLTAGGEVSRWRESDLIRALREGVTPTGEKLDPDKMPWRSVGKLTDEEIKAIWLYIRSLPAIPDRFPTPTRAR